MASVTLVGYDALRARLERVGHCDRRLMALLLKQAEFEARTLVPKRSHNLSRSIGVVQTSDTSGKLFARAKYAEPVEKGSREHTVTSNAKKALMFAVGAGARLTGSARVGAAVVFSMWARIPAMPARPYLVPGAKKAIKGSGLEKEIVSVWEGKP